ncbi:MAG: TIGR03986 family CRISPR-associated RAMP protein [Anaerolineae bacterium]|nr:TIGR03986 family CRISPR-associated RAMP protein [Anaerolineae bacterium]
MNWPKHTSPNRQHKAHAPYNFVPLPEVVRTLTPSQIPGHDVYTGHTGYLDCTLETLTPMYTRTVLTPEFVAKWAENKEALMRDPEARQFYAQFFNHGDPDKPVIPGSSLRGMTRNLVEIVAQAKVQWVTDKQLFFRTMDGTAVSDRYRERMTQEGRVYGGFLRCQDSQYYIQQCDVARVDRALLDGIHRIYTGRPPWRVPRWQGSPAQHSTVWVQLDEQGRNVTHLEYEARSDLTEGRLIITGDIPTRKDAQEKREFVFLLPTSDDRLPVSEALIERFHDDDQITQWQQKAFAKDTPTPGSRQRAGMLEEAALVEGEGDPVFFLLVNGEVEFFGRARSFRLPYQHSPLDLIPEDLRLHTDEEKQPVFDLVEALFGYVADSDRQESRAGRLSFGDAHFEAAKGTVFRDAITPRILSGPKPTTFQQYLVQETASGHDPNKKKLLAHYDTPTPQETVIRGYKLYWHKDNGWQIQNIAESGFTEEKWQSDTQHTHIHPINQGVTFRFKIYFENLSDVELGALLWVLDLPEGHHHKLGMGKPLGLGSVAIKPTLCLTSRESRYTQLLDENNTWATGMEICETKIQATWDKAITAFETWACEDSGKKLAEMPRIKDLLRLLRYPGPKGNDYMQIIPEKHVNEFRERPVLPTPAGVLGEPEEASSRKPTQESQEHEPLYTTRSQTPRSQARAPKPILPRVSPKDIKHPTSEADIQRGDLLEGKVTQVEANRIEFDLGVATGTMGIVQLNPLVRTAAWFADWRAPLQLGSKLTAQQCYKKDAEAFEDAIWGTTMVVEVNNIEKRHNKTYIKLKFVQWLEEDTLSFTEDEN